MLYTFIRNNILFKFDPERAHHITLESLKAAHRLGLSQIVTPPACQTPRTLMGLRFPNPVGLAAGLDKDGDYIDALGSLGFGFLEVGTVTPRPQPGNPKPRLFRMPQAEAIVNRMGFNNKGVDHLTARLREARFSGIIGVNIGKNADTPLERAHEDYRICLRKVYPHASYVTINLSSPNTPNLRQLQFSDDLRSLLNILKGEQATLSKKCHIHVPLVVKLAPDLSDAEVGSISEILANTEMDGVIATNTTLSRDGVEGLKHGREAGGLSGAPLRAKATHVLRLLKRHLDGKLTIIASGGIMNAKDAEEKIKAGADLVQLYTGLAFRGPRIVREIANAAAISFPHFASSVG